MPVTFTLPKSDIVDHTHPSFTWKDRGEAVAQSAAIVLSRSFKTLVRELKNGLENVRATAPTGMHFEAIVTAHFWVSDTALKDNYKFQG